MSKTIPIVLLFFFISGSFVTAFNPISASKIVENSWSTKAPMSQARAMLGVVAVNGKIYVIGGQIAVGRYVGTNECYDPNTDTWSVLESMPTSRASFAIAECQSKIYCMGGMFDYTTCPDFSPIYCDLNEVYDVATDSWSSKTSLPINGSSLQAHVIDGKIFVLAGLDLFMYDPVVDVWTNKTGISEDTEKWTAYSYSSCIANGKIIVFCRFVYLSIVHPYSSYQKIIIYDPKTDTWSEQKEETMDVAGTTLCTTTVHYVPQRIYAIGVRWLADNTQQPFTSVYDYEKDNWSTAKCMSTNRDAFGVAVIDDTVYVIGGLIIGIPADDAYATRLLEYLTLNEQYVPIGYGSVSVPPIPSETLVASKHNHSFSSLTVLSVAVTLAIIIETITVSLVFYFKKKQQR
jgi:hypothetical protein